MNLTLIKNLELSVDLHTFVIPSIEQWLPYQRDIGNVFLNMDNL